MKKIILCGMGNRCKDIYPFIKYMTNKVQNITVCGGVDINCSIKDLDGLPVWSPEILDKDDEDETIYFITVESPEIIKFYKEKLNGKNYVIYKNKQSLARVLDLDVTEINREFCAYDHIKGMDEYFVMAEEQCAIEVFWSEKSLFKQLFDKLEDDNIIELACGRGRHVSHYIEHAGHVTLVDILQKNIEICKDRFKDYNKISYYKNTGFNLCDLPSGNYSALFCYDAMVHFELLDISDYLKDIYRVLRGGGKALLHHSNCDAFYDVSYGNSVHGRTFMNYKIFAYLALQAGFQVLKQEIINWGGNAVQIDCISLIEKPL